MKKEGKGKVDGDPDDKLNEEEDNSPFKQHLKGYVEVLKENKI